MIDNLSKCRGRLNSANGPEAKVVYHFITLSVYEHTAIGRLCAVASHESAFFPRLLLFSPESAHLSWMLMPPPSSHALWLRALLLHYNVPAGVVVSYIESVLFFITMVCALTHSLSQSHKAQSVSAMKLFLRVKRQAEIIGTWVYVPHTTLCSLHSLVAWLLDHRNLAERKDFSQHMNSFVTTLFAERTSSLLLEKNTLQRGKSNGFCVREVSALNA